MENRYSHSLGGSFRGLLHRPPHPPTDGPPIREVEAWRDGDWIMVAVDGELIYRRLTRDRAFDQAGLSFPSSGSPNPCNRAGLHSVVLIASGPHPTRFHRPYASRSAATASRRHTFPIADTRRVVWRDGNVVPDPVHTVEASQHCMSQDPF